MQDSKIEWTHHTFNPWTGCTRVSPGCDNCYAATMAKRNPAAFGSWEPGAERKRTSAAYWQQPFRWNREAERTGTRPRVFCASMADVFDNQVPEAWLEDLWRLIIDTPHLDWLLLTKRPQNIAGRLPNKWGKTGLPNVWLGTTVENQAEADRRIPHLMAVPAAKRFLSCEPLLGPVYLRFVHDAETGECIKGGFPMFGARPTNRLHWVIAGGESGPSARPMHPDWARGLRDQCAAADVPFFFKQWGEWGLAHTGVVSQAYGTLTRHCITASTDRKRIGATIYIAGRGADQGAELMERVGKKAAGRLLDGREHNEVPA